MASRLNWRLSVDGSFTGGSLFALRDGVALTVHRSAGREIQAINRTGQRVWRRTFSFKDTASFFPFGTCLYVDGTAALALDGEAGTERARREFKRTMVRHPNDRGPVYILDPGAPVPKMVGLDPTSLETVWEWDDGLNYACIGEWLMGHRPGVGLHIVNAWTRAETVLAPPALPPDSARDDQFLPLGSDICIVTTRLHRRAYRLPAATTIWKHEEDAPGRHRLLWFDRVRMLCGTEDVRAYSLQTGELLWRATLPDALPERSASAAGRAAFAVAGKRTVCRLDLESGELLGTLELKEDILDLAALDESQVVAGSLDHLYCIEFS